MKVFPAWSELAIVKLPLYSDCAAPEIAIVFPLLNVCAAFVVTVTVAIPAPSPALRVIDAIVNVAAGAAVIARLGSGLGGPEEASV